MTLKPNDFWYTPPKVWDAICMFFYGKPFDPCPVDPTFDGLEVKWPPDSYINPPYSRKLRREFINKGNEQFVEGKSRFLWLLNYGNNVDHYKLHSKGTAVCIPHTRIRFIPGRPELGDGQSPMYDSIFILWGDSRGFEKAFKDIGQVYTTKDIGNE